MEVKNFHLTFELWMFSDTRLWSDLRRRTRPVLEEHPSIQVNTKALRAICTLSGAKSIKAQAVHLHLPGQKP